MNKKPLDWLVRRPIAHRGLHDSANGRIENTLSAVSAAVNAGYSIEVDLQLAADGVPVVFHDYALQRLTGEKGNIDEYTAAELGEMKIGPSQDTVPTLGELLKIVDGRCGLVIELKGQDPEREAGYGLAVCEQLASYHGPAAVMSFKHWLVEDFDSQGSDIPLGLTAEGDDNTYQMHLEINERIDFDFLSYGIRDLPCQFSTEFRSSGKPVITWTIRTAEEAKRSALFADQITFEGYLP